METKGLSTTPFFDITSNLPHYQTVNNYYHPTPKNIRRNFLLKIQRFFSKLIIFIIYFVFICNVFEDEFLYKHFPVDFFRPRPGGVGYPLESRPLIDDFSAAFGGPLDLLPAFFLGGGEYLRNFDHQLPF